MNTTAAATGLIAAFGLVAAACLTPTTDTTTTVTPDTGGTTTTSPSPTTPPTTTAATPNVASDKEIQTLLPDVPVTTLPPDAAQTITNTKLEQQRFYADCLTNAGFAATIDPQTLSVSSPIPPGQEDRFWEVSSRCRQEKFDRFPALAEPDPTAAYRAYLYIRECMLANGYPVTDPPSLDTYLETHGAAWHPYDAVMADPTFTYEDFQQLENTCPQDLTYLIPALGLDQP